MRFRLELGRENSSVYRHQAFVFRQLSFLEVSERGIGVTDLGHAVQIPEQGVHPVFVECVD